MHDIALHPLVLEHQLVRAHREGRPLDPVLGLSGAPRLPWAGVPATRRAARRVAALAAHLALPRSRRRRRASWAREGAAVARP